MKQPHTTAIQPSGSEKRPMWKGPCGGGRWGMRRGGSSQRAGRIGCTAYWQGADRQGSSEVHIEEQAVQCAVQAEGSNAMLPSTRQPEAPACPATCIPPARTFLNHLRATVRRRKMGRM